MRVITFLPLISRCERIRKCQRSTARVQIGARKVYGKRTGVQRVRMRTITRAAIVEEVSFRKQTPLSKRCEL